MASVPAAEAEVHDLEVVLEWLRRRPFLHPIGDTLLVHAGLLPVWGGDEALSLASSASRRLPALLPLLTRKPRPKWSAEAVGDDRLAAAVAIFTRLRVVRPTGGRSCRSRLAPEAVPEGCRPWYEGSRLVAEGTRVVFGHWVLMGYRPEPGAVCIDSGCVYGGELTAWCLDEDRIVQVTKRDP